jgi:hypothetical protein
MLTKVMIKSSFYTTGAVKVGKVIIDNIFSTQSNERHSHTIRPIQKLYGMSNIMKAEPLVDKTIENLLKQLDERFVTEGATCRMDQWLHFYAWDVVGQLTFSKPMGFLDQGFDHIGIIKKADMGMKYVAVVGQIPQLDQWLAKNPLYPIGPPSMAYAGIFCAQQSIERQKAIAEGNLTEHNDMLADFLRVGYSPQASLPVFVKPIPSLECLACAQDHLRSTKDSRRPSSRTRVRR